MSEQLIAGLFVFGYGASFAAAVWVLFYLAIKELEDTFTDDPTQSDYYKREVAKAQWPDRRERLRKQRMDEAGP